MDWKVTKRTAAGNPDVMELDIPEKGLHIKLDRFIEIGAYSAEITLLAGREEYKKRYNTKYHGRKLESMTGWAEDAAREWLAKLSEAAQDALKAMSQA